MVVAIVAVAVTRPWWEATNRRPVLVSRSATVCVPCFLIVTVPRASVMVNRDRLCGVRASVASWGTGAVTVT
jgi:hypothetical protein